MAKKPSPYRGKLVHIRKTWGNERGQVDEESLFLVRSCGPTMATLDRVDPKTLQPMWRRGHTFYLTPKDVAEQRMRDSSSFYFWDWSQFFVPQGEAGWDPDQNY